MDAWEDGWTNENGMLSFMLSDAHGPKRVLFALHCTVVLCQGTHILLYSPLEQKKVDRVNVVGWYIVIAVIILAYICQVFLRYQILF